MYVSGRKKGEREREQKHMSCVVSFVEYISDFSCLQEAYNISGENEKINPNCVMTAFIQVDSMLIEYCMPGTFTTV